MSHGYRSVLATTNPKKFQYALNSALLQKCSQVAQFQEIALATTSSGVATGTAVGISAGVLGGAGTIASSLLMPKAPDYTGYTPASYQVQQQQFNSQQIATTGSGGRQASASLAEAISRSKKRKLSQADVSDLSIDTSSFASTGLQFA